MDGIVVLVGLAMAVGVVGTLVPFVPGLGLCWAAALVYGLVEGFETAGIAAFVLITALTAGGTIAGYAVPARVAGAAGASKVSIVLGALAAIVGFFVIPVVGVIVGGVLGVYAGEYARTRDGAVAWRSTRATLTGFGLAALIQLGVAVAIAATWAVWALVD
jgi:uncharacterized protein YqgC (DUF456 family)